MVATQSKITSIRNVVLAAVWAATSSVALASPKAVNEAAVAVQPDGSRIEIVLQGNATHHWYQTPDGFLVTRDAQGQWVYAEAEANNAKSLSDAWLIKPTDLVVGKDDPLAQGLLPYDELQTMVGGNEFSSVAKSVGGKNPIASKLGEVPMLVIMGYYDDARSAANCGQCATTSADYVQQLFFSTTQNSVADFFDRASQGAYRLMQAAEDHGTANDGVVGWLRLGAKTPEATAMSTSSYKSNKIAADAINAAMRYIDFTQYDRDRNGVVTSAELGITVILGGYEASYGRNAAGSSLEDDASSPRVWGQSRTFATSSSGVSAPQQTVNGYAVTINTQSNGMTYSIVGERHGDHALTMGIITHELGHTLLDLPDLYDTKGASNGVGGWSLMSYGSWGKSREDTHPGSTPVMMDAWSRLALGWSEPIFPESGDLTQLSAEKLDVALIATPNPYEYFLVENRQNQGYDRGLYYFLYTENFGGLAVWHIDDNVGSQNANNDNANVKRKRVDLVAAKYDDRLDAGTSYGHADNLFEASGIDSLNAQTHRGMALYSGEGSGVAITEVSFAAEAMTFHVHYDAGNTSQVTIGSTSNNALNADLSQSANSSGNSGGGGAVNFAMLLLLALVRLKRA